MVGVLAPVAIFVGVSATVIFTFFSFWGSINARATKKAHGMAHLLDRAAISMGAQEIVLTVAAIVALVWLVFVLLFKPPVVVAALLVPAMGLLGGGGYYVYVRIRVQKRLDAFTSQLETALRLIAGGVRVGLGLRQALTMVTEELADPARYEFLRVIGQTNIGVSLLDALDDLAERMPSNESLMMARVIRIQATSGGDLAKVLEQLAQTIKDRRQVHRKISTLTAEGRISALVLIVIPPGLAAVIYVVQPDTGHALFFTTIGHVALAILVVLEAIGYLWLKRILRVEV